MATKKIQKFGTGGLPAGSPEMGGGYSLTDKRQIPGQGNPRMPLGRPRTGPMGPPQGGGDAAQRPTTPTVGMPRPRQPGVTPKPFMPQPGVAPKPSAPTAQQDVGIGKFMQDQFNKSRAMAGGTPRMAKGGGIESKGKTQGKMVKMNRGGRAC